MTGASLGYSGYYNSTSLLEVGTGGRWHSSRVSTTGYSRFLTLRDNGLIYTSDQGTKSYGRAVRYHATQSEPVALIIAIRFNQARTIHSQVVAIGATNYTRRPVVARQRLVVKPTRNPVIVA